MLGRSHACFHAYNDPQRSSHSKTIAWKASASLTFPNDMCGNRMVKFNSNAVIGGTTDSTNSTECSLQTSMEFD